MHQRPSTPHRLQALRRLAVFFCPGRPHLDVLGDARYGHCGGLLALRQPHMARHSRVPSVYGPRKRFAARVRAIYVRIHTFYLKFLQGHTWCLAGRPVRAYLRTSRRPPPDTHLDATDSLGGRTVAGRCLTPEELQ